MRRRSHRLSCAEGTGTDPSHTLETRDHVHHVCVNLRFMHDSTEPKYFHPSGEWSAGPTLIRSVGVTLKRTVRSAAHWRKDQAPHSS
ncbi:hypothetical protein J2129_000457 [Methanofollis sp. W23]|nr:hypothetical protein [Methanofollis sp. W23]